MPRGLNARYLLAMKGQGTEYVAKQWKRTIPKSFKPNEVLIDFKPEQYSVKEVKNATGGNLSTAIPREINNRLVSEQKSTGTGNRGRNNTGETNGSNIQVTRSIAESGVTLSDVKQIFPKAKVTQVGNDFVVNQNGHSLIIHNVETITPNESALKIGYGKLDKSGNIAGKYRDGDIKISKYGDKWTLSHESYHWLEDLGVITALEKNALNIAAKKDESIDHAMSKDEQRAHYIESQLKLRASEREKGIVSRAIQKIADFIDAMVNLVHVTARGVVKGMESGKLPGERVIIGDRKGGEQYSLRTVPLQSSKQTVPQRVYDEMVSKKQPAKSKWYNASHRGTVGWFAEYATPFSTRLEQIHVQIKARFMKFRSDLSQAVKNDAHALEPFLKAVKNMSATDQVYFEGARLNTDPGMLQRLIIKYNIGKEYTQFRKTMDNLFDRGIEVGFDIDYHAHFHPRAVKDPSGFLNYLRGTDAWGVISEAIKDAQAKQPNIPLSEEQEAHIANIIIRGYGGKRITLTPPGAVLERTVPLIDANLMPFYHTENEAAMMYITNMNKAIEARAFFGMRTPVKGAGKQYRKAMIDFMNTQRTERADDIKAIKKDFQAYKKSISDKTTEERNELIKTYINKMRTHVEAFNNKQKADYDKQKGAIKKELKIKETEIKEQDIGNSVDKSIGDYINQLRKSGELPPEKEGELTQLFQAFFNYKPSTGMVDIFKNFGYATAMGNIASAITQMQDLSFSLYDSGFYETGGALGKALKGQSKWTKKQLGLEKIAEEFSNPTKLSRWLNKLFHWTGFEAMDRLGKEILINAAMSRMEKMAQTNEAGLRKELQKLLPINMVEETIADLKTGEITDNTKTLAFIKLAQYQPSDLSETPVGYMLHPGGRVFYMMKTYYIKQIDAMRRESITKILEGHRTNDSRLVREGITNLARFGALLMFMGASADMIRDFMFQRDTKWSDTFWDNFMRLFGLSRYAMWRFRDRGIKDGLVAIFAPPIGFAENPLKDFGERMKLYKENKEIKEGERKGESKDYNIWNMKSWQSLPYGGQQFYWWLGGGHEKVMNRKLSTPLSDSKKRILSSNEKQEFFDELKSAREIGRITAQEARSKRGQFFRNQAHVQAKKNRHNTQ